jgi:hypothetical protein
MVFDFSVLPEEVFPREKWTVNKLTNKYGTPEKIYAKYLGHIEYLFDENEVLSQVGVKWFYSDV